MSKRPREEHKSKRNTWVHKKVKRRNRNIQSNFSIELNGIPLLKKFSSKNEHKNLVQHLEDFDGFAFILKFEEGIAKVIPYISSTEHDLTTDKFKLLREFLKYQLINSGVLPFLSHVPLNGEIILINTHMFKSNNTDAEIFHNDGLLFNIIRYETPGETAVLGSNVLFMDQRKAPAHRYMGTGNFNKLLDLEKKMWDIDEDEKNSFFENFEDNDGQYDVEYAGESLSSTQNQILEMYDTSGLKSVLMRGLYNSGDSLVINDMLVKHSSLKREEYRDYHVKKMTINVERGRGSVSEIVSICDTRIQPTETDLTNRQIIGFAFLKILFTDDNDNFTLEHDYTINIPIVELNDSMNTLQLNIGTYCDFLRTLEASQSSACGIFRIDTSTISQTFKHRGGKTKRKAPKSKRRKRKYK